MYSYQYGRVPVSIARCRRSDYMYVSESPPPVNSSGSIITETPALSSSTMACVLNVMQPRSPGLFHLYHKNGSRWSVFSKPFLALQQWRSHSDKVAPQTCSTECLHQELPYPSVLSTHTCAKPPQALAAARIKCDRSLLLRFGRHFIGRYPSDTLK